MVDFSRISRHAGPEESPGYLLWKVSSLWRRSIEAILRPLGLTHPQFVVLAAIGWFTRERKEVRQVEISRFVGLDPNTTSQVLRSLHTKGLILRGQADGRSKSPSLTPAGSKLLKQALPAVEKEDHAFFSRVDYRKKSYLSTLKALSTTANIPTLSVL